MKRCRAGPIDDGEDERLWSKVGNDSIFWPTFSVVKMAALVCLDSFGSIAMLVIG